MTVALVVVLELEVLRFKEMNAFAWSKISNGSCHHFLFTIVLEWYIVPPLFKKFSNEVSNTNRKIPTNVGVVWTTTFNTLCKPL